MNRDRVIAVLMLSPSVILLAIFVYGFIGITGYTSMTDSNALQQLSGLPSNFTGLKNYNDLFTGALNEKASLLLVGTPLANGVGVASSSLKSGARGVADVSPASGDSTPFTTDATAKYRSTPFTRPVAVVPGAAKGPVRAEAAVSPEALPW